jgi:hypothetical protein
MVAFGDGISDVPRRGICYRCDVDHITENHSTRNFGASMLSYHPARSLSLCPDYDKKGTSTIWTRNPNGKAVVFIHGYGGDALTTWAELNKHLPESRGFEQW